MKGLLWAAALSVVLIGVWALLRSDGGSTRRESGDPPALVLANVTVIDGLGGPPVAGQTIVIRDGLIEAVRPAGAEDAEALDLSDHYVVPGLIDSHVHLPRDEARLRAHLDSLLGVGITSLRDMACCADLYQRVTSEADPARYPRLFYSAFWADPVFFSDDPRVSNIPSSGQLPWLLAVTDSTPLEMAIRDAKASGATGIKIYSNLHGSRIAAIAVEAHRQGMRVWSHPVVFPTRPSDVLDSGVDVISHSALLVWEVVDELPARYNAAERFNPFGPPAPFSSIQPDDPRLVRLLEMVRSRGVILDATVSTIEGAVGREASDWALRVTALAHAMGIPIAAGTDNPGAGEGALFGELTMLVDEVGLTPLEALTAATLTGARVLGVEDRLGSIENGKVADLVVLRGDPSVDINNARGPVYVIKDGSVVRAQSREP